MNEVGYLLAAIVALAGGIGLLWRQSNVDKAQLRQDLREEITRRDNAVLNLTKRIEKIETERLDDERKHSEEIRALTVDVTSALNSNRDALLWVAHELRRINPDTRPPPSPPPPDPRRRSGEHLPQDEQAGHQSKLRVVNRPEDDETREVLRPARPR
jgi:hypothetical protein